MKPQKINIPLEAKAEIEKMMSGKLYDATRNQAILQLLSAAHDRCFDYNQLRPSQNAERTALIRALLGSCGSQFKIISPFLCDFGFNIEIGENFFANTHLVILDEAKVTFGDNVFIGPNCSFYTAGHPLDVEDRNAGLEYSLPITVGNDVWFCGGVTVVPGVTIGDGAVVAAGAVVVHDVPPYTLVAGNPARPIKSLKS